MSMPLGRATVPTSMQFSELARDLFRMPAATRKELRVRFEQIGQPMLADARRRASWSTRIPGAMSVRGFTDQAKGRVGVELRVSSQEAPHGRVYEGITGGALFRHPVYGHEGRWATGRARPYAAPAVRARADAAQRAVVNAVEAAARECGFR